MIFTCVRLNVQHFKISKQKTTELFCCFFFRETDCRIPTRKRLAFCGWYLSFVPESDGNFHRDVSNQRPDTAPDTPAGIYLIRRATKMSKGPRTPTKKRRRMENNNNPEVEKKEGKGGAGATGWREWAELRMAVVGAGVRKLTSRSHLEAESIGGTCTSQEGDERRRRDPFPSLDTTRTHNTLLPASPGGPRPQGKAGPGPTVGANPVGQWDDRSSRLLVASPPLFDPALD